MKILMIMILTLSLSDAFATELKVSNMKLVPGMDASFVLGTNLLEKVVLDCQSFIHGLTVGEKENQTLFMLEEDECSGLYKRIQTSLSKKHKHCLDLEEVIRSDYSCD